MIQRIKRAIAQWLFPELLEELHNSKTEIEILKEDNVKQQDTYSSKLKELEYKLVHYKEDSESRQKMFVDVHYEQIRQRLDATIFDRALSVNRAVTSFVYRLLYPDSFVAPMVNQTYKDVGAQLSFDIKHHQKTGSISCIKDFNEYMAEEVSVLRIRIPEHTFYVRIRPDDLTFLKNEI